MVTSLSIGSDQRGAPGNAAGTSALVLRTPIGLECRRMEIAPLSHTRTSARVLGLLDALDWTRARVADVGAGNGYFSQALGERLLARGIDPAAHIAACDVVPSAYRYAPVECRAIGDDGRLPFADETFDAVVSIEVIEHVENQFAFVRELARIARRGAIVIVTTPNVLNANSRTRTLLQGFPLLFDPLPVEGTDVRHVSGHIHPISPYYLAIAARRAGLVDPTFHPDRTKTSAALLTALLAPGLRLAAAAQRRRLRRKWAGVYEQNAALLSAINGWGMLTCRTAVLCVRKE
jgi:SAM-dependent methyltransferase